MYSKGDTNFEIANHILYNPLKSYQQHDLYSLIVNRWYYGLFLMAKSKLNPTRRFNHRDCTDRRGDKIKGLWSLLGNCLNDTNTAQKGLTLFECREKLDYWRNDPIVEQKIFIRAQNLAKEIRRIL